jgi:hypothetical protein
MPRRTRIREKWTYKTGKGTGKGTAKGRREEAVFKSENLILLYAPESF